MCHRNIIKNNDFKFNYGSTGHGAYMVSSNAGSWSDKDNDKNNKVMAFDFYDKDTITVRVNFEKKYV